MSIRRARVTAAYATCKILDPVMGKWTVAGFSAGAPFPAEADPDNVATLVRRGYAEWLDDVPEVVKPRTAEDKMAEDAAARRAEDAASKKAEEEAGRPKDVAPKAQWVDYAVSRRADDVSEEDARLDADGKTKADLIAEFGG